MIERLVAALRAAGTDLDWRDLADVLWLAEATRPPTAMVPQERRPAARVAPGLADGGPGEPPAAVPDAGDSGAAAARAAAEASAQPPLIRRGTAADAGTRAFEFRAPAGYALPGRLGIGRALRPFKQTRRSKQDRVFDTDATIEHYCDTRVLVPITVPARERWFRDLALVSDGGPTMAVWRETIAALAELLGHHGAFERVTRWTLTEGDDAVRLSSPSGLQHAPGELADHDGRRLTFVVTDCVGRMWHRDAVWAALRDWGRLAPVALVQTLPPRLWPATALGDVDVAMASRRRGEPNRRLSLRPPWWWDAEVAPEHATPVVTLDEQRLGSWARMVMSDGLEVTGVVTQPSLADGAAPPSAPPNAEERVAAFRATVSDEASRLATLLSAVEVSLPVARLLLQELIPEGRQTHLAEVLVGGLLQSSADDAYEFAPDVRELLQRSLTTTDTIEVWRVVAPYLEASTGQRAPFSMLLEPKSALPAEDASAPSARIAAALIDRLGLNAPLPSRAARDAEPAAAPAMPTRPHGDAATRRPVRVTRALIRVEEYDSARDAYPVALHIDGAEGRFEVVAASAEIPGTLAPPNPPELWGEPATPEAIRAVLREPDRSPDLEAIGIYLHDLLAQDQVGAVWRGFAAFDGLQTLLDVHDQRLRRLPWELMQRDGKRLAADTANPLLRVGGQFAAASALPELRWPLRLLVVVGSRDDDVVVEAEAEVDRLLIAFRRMPGLLDLEVLRGASRERMAETYRMQRPHILHFIGNASSYDGRAGLLLYDAARAEFAAWTTEAIWSDIAGWVPRLVILNACRSIHVEEQEAASSVADVFTDIGVPAVVAMQGDIRSDAAVAFTGGLYPALNAGEPIDVAVAAGRREITAIAPFDRADFALPCLTVTSPPEGVLRMRFGANEAHSRELEPVQRRVRAFVDRNAERRMLWRELDLAGNDAMEAGATSDAVVITGRGRAGKTELARWCVGICECHGGNAAYVDFLGQRRASLVEALRAIRDALGQPVVHGAENLRRFESWNDDGPLAAIMEPFVDALRAAAGERPLLLAFDNVGGVEEGAWNMICDRLLAPIARHQLAGVRAILVLSEEQRHDRLSGSLEEALGPPIELAPFRPAEFAPIARQYLSHHFDVAPDDVNARLDLIKPTENFDWETLRALESLAPAFGWSRFR